MFRSFWTMSLLALGFLSAVANAQTPLQLDSAEAQGAREIGQQFLKAFNAHDAEALGQLWKEDGTYSSPSLPNGELSGKKAITEAYRKLFETNSNATISARDQVAAAPQPNQLLLGGVLEIVHTNGLRTASRFSAEIDRVDGTWLIARVLEVEIPATNPPAAYLQQLQWFIGNWEQQGDGYSIKTRVRSTPTGNFILRNYQRTVGDQVVSTGAQTIGWDAEQGCFRSWMFEDDGAFGEGVWKQDGEKSWSIQFAIKYPDGSRGSLTQKITIESNDLIHMQNVGVEVAGESRPNSPIVSLKRTAAESTRLR
ncbi:nuclear transport factor 2 family protein [Planctomicrobium sp. SH668]|uniref:nuclear transport factor 2 family protein n=1 Tax=Planctomicrobium sp. SH668 TaxID=3448126 RepID=UPI003F5B80F2